MIMKGVGFVSEYDGMPKLSTIDCSGRVHPGVLTRVGGVDSLADSDPSPEWCTGLLASSAIIDASPPVAFDTSSATILAWALGIHACKRIVDSVEEDPPRAFVLASRISDNVARDLILGPYSFAIVVLFSSRFFDSFSMFSS